MEKNRGENMFSRMVSKALISHKKKNNFFSLDSPFCPTTASKSPPSSNFDVPTNPQIEMSLGKARPWIWPRPKSY